jgi:neurotransmitter:Na+ symporter, NSS family
MPETRGSIHGQWSSRFVFILAAVGSAVGLGNIWKFPYITGENGGGAFVLVYLICIALIGVPIMMAEILMGRRGRQSPINTMRVLVADEKAHPVWRWLGWLGVVTGFLILSYYSVIAGWALAYVFRAGAGLFTGADAETTAGLFSRLLGSPESMLGWHTIFMVMTMAVVARGVRGGLEKAVTLLMPALFALLVILVLYALYEGDFARGVAFLFNADFDKVFQQCELAGFWTGSRAASRVSPC